MKLELTKQRSNSLDDISHCQIASNTHPMTDTEGDEISRYFFLPSQPAIRVECIMIAAPDIRVVVEHIVGYRNTGLRKG